MGALQSLYNIYILGSPKVWFAFINFLGDELYHPLDFFSNKMRTRHGKCTFSSSAILSMFNDLEFRECADHTGTFLC